MGDLKYTMKFIDHAGGIVRRHFELMDDLDYVSHVFDSETYRKYVRDLMVLKPEQAHLTDEQNYLRCLFEITGPVVAATHRAQRVRRLQPGARGFAPWAKFEETGKMLAMEAYHFKTRMRLFREAISRVLIDSALENELSKDFGRIIRAFDKSNSRLLRYRNFVVHGPKGQFDEFEGLRGMALSAQLLHPDLWFEYDNVFEEVKERWIELSRELVISMEIAVSGIQSINERILAKEAFSFLNRHSVPKLNMSS